MPKTLLLLLLLFAITPYLAKGQGCEALIKDARSLAKNLKFDDAIKKVEAAKGCAGQAEIDKLYSEIFAGLKKQTSDANKAKERAEKAEKIALSEKEKATASEKIAIAEKLRADSIAETNRRQALRAYANDLAYKSQIALQRGDRTTAYRLAEFAHRYVDDDNLQVTRALVDALYYNDDPAHPPLPWASNLLGHTSVVRSVAFSPDGKRLATGSNDETAKIWEVTAPGCLGVGGRVNELAGLTLPQLSDYGLENLLDAQPNNEATLLAGGDIWQIAAFADLYANKIAKSLPKKADYERAKRLYQTCLASDVDKPYFEKKLSELEQLWKEKTE